ncbi:hypothetical protein K7J14_01355 [Treponema zuelzerae]|uniref:Uncharacterized protein n=1 Tax=Teretinema zuelzerae TaxID=156 RepID=A0AAE3EH06_9SPIR|nr:hypothetical protein [Spirochaetales bacterium]MCD1653344.1 hypothetical protein [Teretinema zuelzerae]
MTREDAIFTIGYDGSAALVDKSARKNFGRLSLAELLEKGLFRAAAAAAMDSGKREDLQAVAEAYNAVSGSSYKSESIPRLFGVAKVTVNRVLAL